MFIFGTYISSGQLVIMAAIVVVAFFLKFNNRRRATPIADPAPAARRSSWVAATFRGIWAAIKGVFRLFRWKSANAKLVEAFIAATNENVGKSSATAATNAKEALARLKNAGDASRLNHDAFMLFVPNLRGSLAGHNTSRMEDILENIRLAAQTAAVEKINVVNELTDTRQSLVLARTENTTLNQSLGQKHEEVNALRDAVSATLIESGRVVEEAVLIREIISNPRAATLSAARGELKGMEKQAQFMRPAPQATKGGGNNNQNRNNQNDNSGGSDNNGGNRRGRGRGNQTDDNQNEGARSNTGG